MKQTYKPHRFKADGQALVDQANAICAQYQAQGYDITLRQLYYQFVARGIIANSVAEYEHLGRVTNDARLAGQMDWDYITDRTRGLREVSNWEDPQSALAEVAQLYRGRKWDAQSNYVEVWVEKDALVGVLQVVCDRNYVAYFSCRGYCSLSEMRDGAQRLIRHTQAGQDVVLLYLGDHDPSGVDMTRDIKERLHLLQAGVDVRRVALNMDQVQQYGPPPNPAKITDSRSEDYIRLFGTQSWELDALDPAELDALIEAEILGLRDDEEWTAAEAEEADQRQVLAAIAVKYADIELCLKGEQS